MTRNEIGAKAEATLMGLFVPVKGDLATIKGILTCLDEFFKNAGQTGFNTDEVLRLTFQYV